MAGLRFRTIDGVRRLAAATIRPCRRTSLGHLILPASSPVDDRLAGDHLTAWRRGHAGHSHRRDGEEADEVFRLGLAADFGLAVGKAMTGYLSGSTAIIADAAHSVSDVVLSGVALWSFRVARTPKDNEHPYGHGKFETLGALGISCMLLGTAGGIAWHAIDVLQVILTATPDIISWTSDHAHNHSNAGHHHGIDMEHPLLALSMTIVAISVKEGLYWITKRVGEREGSALMKANAWHHRADAISSVVALIGVGGAILGVKFLDPLAGILVSGMILKAGIETGYQSVMELVDAAVPSSVIDPMKKTILQVEGVKDCHRMRGRRAGSSLYLDVHIEVDPFLSVSAAHDIGENVRHEIQRSHPDVVEMFIHIDPKVSDSAMISKRQKVMYELSDDASSMGPDKQDIAAAVVNVFSSKFAKVMELEHITHHSLKGEFLLQVQVTMSSDMLISDAKDLAKEAQKEILAAAPCVSQVSILLRLGPKIVQMFDRNQNGKGYIF